MERKVEIYKQVDEKGGKKEQSQIGGTEAENLWGRGRREKK